MSRRGRALMLGAAAAAALLVVVLADVEAPGDLGTWAPVALDGAALSAVAATSAGMVVGGHRGATLVDGDGRARDLALDEPVHALLAVDGAVLAATDSGVRAIDRATGEVRDLGPDERVDALAEHADGLLAVAGGVLLRRAGEGWETVLDGGVRTVAVVDGDVLVGLASGLARLVDGAPEPVLDGPAIDLVAAVEAGDERRLFAAGREHPRLWASPGVDGPWEPSGDGLRLATVEAVAADPGRPGRVLAAGTGLADGDQTGGVSESDDGGRTWTDRQDRLANVHVLGLAVRDEPLRARLSVAGAELTPVPVTPPRPRVYAATNGAGLYARQAPLPLSDATAALAPVGRLLAPAVLGAVALLAAWRGFVALRAPGRGHPGGTGRNERDL